MENGNLVTLRKIENYFYICKYKKYNWVLSENEDFYCLIRKESTLTRSTFNRETGKYDFQFSAEGFEVMSILDIEHIVYDGDIPCITQESLLKGILIVDGEVLPEKAINFILHF